MNLFSEHSEDEKMIIFVVPIDLQESGTHPAEIVADHLEDMFIGDIDKLAGKAPHLDLASFLKFFIEKFKLSGLDGQIFLEVDKTEVDLIKPMNTSVLILYHEIAIYCVFAEGSWPTVAFRHVENDIFNFNCQVVSVSDSALDKFTLYA